MFGKSKKKPLDIGRTPESAKCLATELQRLMALPLDNTSDVKLWYSECGKVQRVLNKRFPKFEFHEEVWHFFADADVRARDGAYRDRQHRLISDYITQLDAPK